MILRHPILVCLLLLAVAPRCLGQQSVETAIDRYVKQADDAFQWKIVSQQELDGVQSIIVDMRSQRWLTPEQVNQPEWQHWVSIAIPNELRSDAGFLMIAGGSNGGEAPKTVSQEIMMVAKATGTVVAELKMVPNQPLIFHGDGVPRKEDDLIGYTWDQYLKTGDANWLARNAMVKSAVRAMDTMTAVARETRQHELKRFVVAGGSKRGWTTWLTGAIDERVVAIVPIVIDVLNVDKSMRHHFAAYGYWAPAIGNYVQHGIMQRLDHPRIAELYELVDPFAYRHRLTMPKLILNAAGDQFFLPDSAKFYFDDLPGENHLRYVPNADHSLRDGDAMQTLIAFYFTVAHGIERPTIDWNLDAQGALHASASRQPVEVRLWQATNPETRDFRLETLGPKYTSRPIAPAADGSFIADLQAPAQGWTASFIEFTFDVGAPVPLKLTTQVYVTPDTLPYTDRDPSLPPSVTLRGMASSGKAASEILEQAQQLMQAKLSIADVTTELDGTVFYLNWEPGDFEGEAGPVIKWLESQAECECVNIQLEAGRRITTVCFPKESASAAEKQ